MQDFIFHEKEIIIDEQLSNTLKYWKDIIDEKINNIIIETKEEMYADNKKEALLTILFPKLFNLKFKSEK